MLFLYGNIAGVFEIVGALLLGEEIEEFADLSPGCLDVTRLGSSDQVFEFGEDLLDRIEVGAVRRQEESDALPWRGWRRGPTYPCDCRDCRG